MTSTGLLLRASPAVLLAILVLARPTAADDSSATLKLALTPGTTIRYILRGELHTDQTTTYNDDSTDNSVKNQVFEQIVRYEIGDTLDDGSSDATIFLDSLTVREGDNPPVTRTDLAQAKGRMLPTGALRDVKVISGNVSDLDRLSISAFAFEYPTEPMNIDEAVDRGFPLQLLVTWHREHISAHSQTKLTSVSTTAAEVTQDVDFHEADVPAAPGVVASADVTATATHTIDLGDGWPRTGRAEGTLATKIDTSAAPADAATDEHVAVVTAGIVTVVQSYERQ